MVPISLLIWIVLEIAAWLALGRYFFALDWPQAIGGSILGLLGLRIWMNATCWWFAMKYGSPARPLGLPGRVQIMLGEYLAFLFTFLLVIPLERLWMPPDRLRPGRRPILLVHGYGVSRGCWWLLRRRLEAAGHNVASLSLIPPYTGINSFVPQLAKRIEEVCAASGSEQITLLAHSMGGLVCRAYLASHGKARVNKLVTLASPHAGTELARLGLGQNARQMEPNSLWLRELAGKPTAAPTISLRNPYDNYAMPQDNQRLPGAADVELPPIGHIAMLYSREIADIVLDACRDQGSQP